MKEEHLLGRQRKVQAEVGGEMAEGLSHPQFLKFPDRRWGLATPPQSHPKPGGREEGPEL